VASSIGGVLRRAREIRQLSTGDAARAAGISPAYLNRLENDAVKKPSPHVLHQLSDALAIPYDELLRLSGYPLPNRTDDAPAQTVGAALFADLTDDEREELLEYLAWYRSRRRSSRAAGGAT
jgi:HTH-type transcriptional regulator, competence development regulator